MKPVTLYAYKNCDTCRKALQFLKDHNVPHQVLPIREQPPTRAELERMLEYYKGDFKKLFNTSGLDYKSLNMKEKLPGLSAAEALSRLACNGHLIKRPFLLAQNGGQVGFRPEEWKRLLGL